MDDFNKPKVCWNRIAAEKQFALVDEGIFIQDSMHFIVGANLEYLASVLNSKLIQWLLALIIGDAAGGNAGNADNVLNLCIPYSKINEKISDEEIYRIYNLTNEEIKKNNANTIVLVILILVFLGITGFGVYYFLFRNRDKTPNKNDDFGDFKF